MDTDESWDQPMWHALAAARSGAERGEVPVGAVIVRPDGSMSTPTHNRTEELDDPTAHAEMLAIGAACRALGDNRLTGHTLVVTLEPCPMCAGAAVHARLDRIVYAAPDPKAGAAWSLYNIPQDPRLNHRCEIIAGVMSEESSLLLTDFFAQRR
jgi:tRNA(adenine34) deaminase